MAVRKILSIPDPILYEVSQEVNTFDSELRKLSLDMFETMYQSYGVGLAAVQIGVLKRLMVIDLGEAGFSKEVFVNPKVLFSSKELQDGDEGCLSIPGISASLRRPAKISIEYQNLFGEKKVIDAEALFARAILHEIDHMDGKVFIDLLEPEIYQNVKDSIHELKTYGYVKLPVTPEYRKKVLK